MHFRSSLSYNLTCLAAFLREDPCLATVQAIKGRLRKSSFYPCRIGVGKDLVPFYADVPERVKPGKRSGSYFLHSVALVNLAISFSLCAAGDLEFRRTPQHPGNLFVFVPFDIMKGEDCHTRVAIARWLYQARCGDYRIAFGFGTLNDLNRVSPPQSSVHATPRLRKCINT